MIDPLVGLAFSVYSNKGVYALLLGSGLSRSAEIPTGWEVTLDLIRKVAALKGSNCEPDPATWYQQTFGIAADYSDLLENLALTPAERTKTLSSYFEPTAEDIASGRKMPTAAHHAIARLVAEGYIRIIVTTNFDRLMEQALESAGVSPSVIASADAAIGSMPLVHNQCTLIKIHGDYRDTRIKNTVRELATYDSALDELLDRVFDEYGVIACGWSATWDTALRSAITRNTSRRFTFWWATKGGLSEEAKQLVTLRQGSIVPIESADQFFSNLAEKIDALVRVNAPHPLSAAIAEASLKKFLSEDRYRIELNDLVFREVRKQNETFGQLPTSRERVTCGDYMERLKFYALRLEILLALIITGASWSRGNQNQMWLKVVERLANDASTRPGNNTGFNMLQRYPALLSLYACGLSAVAVGNYELLKALLNDGRTTLDVQFDGKAGLLINKVSVTEVFDYDFLKQCLGKNYYTPASEYLHQVLRPKFLELLPNDHEFDSAFDRFEYLLALSYLKDQIKRERHHWAPVGRFAYRRRSERNDIAAELLAEIRQLGGDWKPILAGLFSNADEFFGLEEALRQEVLVHTRSWL